MGAVSGKLARWVAAAVAEGLASDPRVRLVVLFGSAADSGRDSVGDVDLGVLAEPAIAPDDLLKTVATLSEGPGIAVDVVDLRRAGPVLAKEIADNGETLFCRTPEDELEFTTRARARFWDFKPFLDEQDRLIRQRREKRIRGPET